MIDTTMMPSSTTTPPMTAEMINGSCVGLTVTVRSTVEDG